MVHTVNGQKFLKAPSKLIRSHVKPLFVECLCYKGYLSYNEYFYMAVFRDNFSIQ